METILTVYKKSPLFDLTIHWQNSKDLRLVNNLHVLQTDYFAYMFDLKLLCWSCLRVDSDETPCPFSEFLTHLYPSLAFLMACRWSICCTCSRFNLQFNDHLQSGEHAFLFGGSGTDLSLAGEMDCLLPTLLVHNEWLLEYHNNEHAQNLDPWCWGELKSSNANFIYGLWTK